MHSENLEGATAVDMPGAVHSAAEAEADTNSISKESNEIAHIFDTSEGRLLGSFGLMTKYATKGDWEAAETLLNIDPSVDRAVITGSGNTALHVAAAAKNTKFVRELVKRMSEDDLLTKDSSGCTAFFYAVASGKVQIAALMREKNPSLITIGRENTQMTPLNIAALLGYKDMFSFLYKFTRPQDLSTDDWFQVFIATLATHMYDEALDILKINKSVAIMRNGDGTRALHHLARRHIVDDISASKEAIFKTLVTLFDAVPCLSWLKKKFEQPLMQKKALLLAERLWDAIQASKVANIAALVITHPSVLHDDGKRTLVV
ncbi:hypothetical protein BUALT_Bualt03G0006800 [Buddleja alternifolia]|uniref:Uncharacterized protein n=1 Tax=Buddleja alternifolia TaxID=168488 RepID=A0AAV6Y0X9_9LAMI|nr:hypothetical protein BUALT_Bualt03G0006800 [Buddleja alternifolia]